MTNIEKKIEAILAEMTTYDEETEGNFEAISPNPENGSEG